MKITVSDTTILAAQSLPLSAVRLLAMTSRLFLLMALMMLLFVVQLGAQTSRDIPEIDAPTKEDVARLAAAYRAAEDDLSRIKKLAAEDLEAKAQRYQLDPTDEGAKKQLADAIVRSHRAEADGFEAIRSAAAALKDLYLKKGDAIARLRPALKTQLEKIDASGSAAESALDSIADRLRPMMEAAGLSGNVSDLYDVAQSDPEVTRILDGLGREASLAERRRVMNEVSRRNVANSLKHLASKEGELISAAADLEEVMNAIHGETCLLAESAQQVKQILEVELITSQLVVENIVTPGPAPEFQPSAASFELESTTAPRRSPRPATASSEKRSQLDLLTERLHNDSSSSTNQSK